MIEITASAPYKTLRPNDADFSFSPDGVTVVARAGLEISHTCPQRYREIIQSCLHHGWLRPVAHMRDIEYTMELLKK
jgi:hypothetical protein